MTSLFKTPLRAGFLFASLAAGIFAGHVEAISSAQDRVTSHMRLGRAASVMP
jgi:hypothetical protein